MKYFSALLIIIFLIMPQTNVLSFAQMHSECKLQRFGNIIIEGDLDLNGTGQNIDSIEFWESPDSSQTLMFVTAKENRLVEVWKFPFEANQIASLTHTTFNNSPVNGVLVDQNTNLLYISIGSPSSTVSVFSLPDLNFLSNFNRAGANYYSEPNLALLNLNDSSKKIYVSTDFTVDIHNTESGEFLLTFTPQKGLETMAADSFYQRLYFLSI